MSRRFLTGLLILVCLSLSASECYAWPPEPIVYISDWHKYTPVGEDVEVYAEVVNYEVAGPIDYWIWNKPPALHISGPPVENDYNSTATFYSYTPGQYTVYAHGFDHYGQSGSDWAYVYVIDVEILDPDDEDEFELSESNYTKTPNITFKARVLPVGVDGTINWTLDLSWDPSPERLGFTSQRTPTSQSDEEHIEVYEEEGGELEVKASATVDGVTCEENTITVYVKGHSIPNATICTRVKNLYDPDSELSQSEKDKLADLNWTDGICFGIIVKESSTMQFYNGAVYNYPDTVRMPYVSDDNTNDTYGDDNDGSHVGLMQVVTTKERSWNWLTNTEYGVDFYQGDKFDIALDHWQDVKDEFSDATKWTAAQLEDCAVGKYGPYAGVGWYWNWDKNDKEWEETTHAGLKNYVDYIRANACE